MNSSDAQFAAVADASYDAALDEALGLQSTSIRLPKALIKTAHAKTPKVPLIPMKKAA
jgi:hypothetical protein